ncbi:MAG: hypothetical protein CM15mP74_35060 [Halieaceae bacterium]|nr:MAG: hypothetical protein CM15mP74_35060 [Halieaceae bacterium]
MCFSTRHYVHPGHELFGGLPPNWFLGIEPNAFGVVGAIVNFGVTLGVTRLTPRLRTRCSSWWRRSGSQHPR